MDAIIAMWLAWSGLTLMSILFAGVDPPEIFWWNLKAWFGLMAGILAFILFAPIILVLIRELYRIL